MTLCLPIIVFVHQVCCQETSLCFGLMFLSLGDFSNTKNTNKQKKKSFKHTCVLTFNVSKQILKIWEQLITNFEHGKIDIQ